MTSEINKKYGERMIEDNRLTCFENKYQARDYTIRFTCPEFTCKCPLSGFPDFATIHIEYQPAKLCVELKSLKLYINQFRETSMYHEEVANQILSDLVDLLDPKYLRTHADFNVRGNIHTTVTASHGEKNQAVG